MAGAAPPENLPFSGSVNNNPPRTVNPLMGGGLENNSVINSNAINVSDQKILENNEAQDNFVPAEQTVKVMPPEFRETGGLRPLNANQAQNQINNVANVMDNAAGIPSPPDPSKVKRKGGISKKMIIIVLLLIVLSGGIYVYLTRFANVDHLVNIIKPDQIAPGQAIPAINPEGTSEITQPTSSPDVTQDLNKDSDGDGLTDIQEKNLGTNLLDADSDKDGIPDGWEVAHNLNPLDPGDAKQDPDGDGLDNANEYYYNTDPFNQDTDSDGYTDSAEVEKGYDPTKGGGAKLEKINPEEKGVSTSPEERDKKRKEDLEALQIAFELYYEDNQTFPENLSNLVPDYVVAVPQDPLAPESNYQYRRVSQGSYEFTIRIESDNDPQDLADGIKDQLYKVTVTE